MKGMNELQKLFFQQTEEFQEKLNVIDWLMHPDGYRASGRTYALALVYIKQAYETGRPIHLGNHDFFNHYGGHTLRNNTSFRELAGKVHEIMKTLPSLEFQISERDNTLQVRTKMRSSRLEFDPTRTRSS